MTTRRSPAVVWAPAAALTAYLLQGPSLKDTCSSSIWDGVSLWSIDTLFPFSWHRFSRHRELTCHDKGAGAWLRKSKHASTENRLTKPELLYQTNADKPALGGSEWRLEHGYFVQSCGKSTTFILHECLSCLFVEGISSLVSVHTCRSCLSEWFNKYYEPYFTFPEHQQKMSLFSALCKTPWINTTASESTLQFSVATWKSKQHNRGSYLNYHAQGHFSKLTV